MSREFMARPTETTSLTASSVLVDLGRPVGLLIVWNMYKYNSETHDLSEIQSKKMC